MHNYLMINLKIEKTFVLFLTSKTQKERFVGEWQIDNFGALFLLEVKIEQKQKLDSFPF